jgi:NADH-quinone oxidoreductase subunit L
VLPGYEFFLIPGLPLLAFLLISALALRKEDEQIAPAFIILALLGSLALSVRALLTATALAPEPLELALPWLSVGSLSLDLGVLIDHLSAVMMIVVCLSACWCRSIPSAT